MLENAIVYYLLNCVLTFVILFFHNFCICSVPPGASLHLFLHRSEEDGLPASAQFSDRRPVLVSRPDSSRSFLSAAYRRHWNHVLHLGGQPRFTQPVRMLMLLKKNTITQDFHRTDECVLFISNHHTSSLLVGCRVRYRQPQSARHEDGVQDHAFHHPPPHHQLPHGQSVDHLHHSFFF